MGNEFGHPEWIDFPRPGNNQSYDKCRRKWNLKYNEHLRFGQLAAWDEQMNFWEGIFNSMISEH